MEQIEIAQAVTPQLGKHCVGFENVEDEMSERFADFTRQLAERSLRRKALMGLGALGLGSLGVLGFGEAGAKTNKNDTCRTTCRNN